MAQVSGWRGDRMIATTSTATICRWCLQALILSSLKIRSTSTFGLPGGFSRPLRNVHSFLVRFPGIGKLRFKIATSNCTQQWDGVG